MKKILVLFLVTLAAVSCSAQKTKSLDFSIDQNKNIKKKGIQLVLKEVISDSRCPEGTNCVWAGEAQVLVSIYKNKKWMDEMVLTFNSKKAVENQEWLAKTIGLNPEKIKSLQLIPYPKEGQKIDAKSYRIKVIRIK